MFIRQPVKPVTQAGFRTLANLVALVLAVLFCDTAFGQQSSPSGTSSRSQRIDAVRTIPFNKISQSAGRRIKGVVKNPSFYRRLPVESIDVDDDFFRFLVRKPEVMVSIWQLMGVTKMTIQRTAPYVLRTDDGAGATSDVELIYGNDNLHIYFAKGNYTGPLLKQKITGRCVMVLRTTSKQTSSGALLTSQLDVFLKVDNAAASLITRTIQPLVGATADHNFVESLKFAQKLNESTRNNGPGVKAMGKRLQLAEQVEQEFFAVVDDVFDRAYSKRYGSDAHPPMSSPERQPTGVARKPRENALQAFKGTSFRANEPLTAPRTAAKPRIVVRDPSAYFGPESKTPKGIDSQKPDSFSILIGGPRPPLSSRIGTRSTQAATPAAHSASIRNRVTDSPTADSRQANPVGGQYIPVHKVPR